MNDIDLYMYTVKEYKKITENRQLSLGEYDNSNLTYARIQLRLILLRKYVSQKENVYIGNILKMLLSMERNKDGLYDLIDRFDKFNNSKILHKISDGTELSLYQSIEDIMYGLHLHADKARVNRLLLTHEEFPSLLAYDFVKDAESILLQLFDYIKTNNILVDNSSCFIKSPVVLFETNNGSILGVKNSPYWSNVSGNDILENHLTDYIKDLCKEDKEIFSTVFTFIQLITMKPLKIKSLKRLVCKSTITGWGNFQSAAEYVSKIPNIGFSNIVRYNTGMKEAYVYLFPNVTSGFSVNSKQLLSNIHAVRLKRKIFSNEFKIYSLGGEVPKNLVTKERVKANNK